MQDLKEQKAQVIYDNKMNVLDVKLSGFIPFDHFKKIMNHEFDMIRHYNLKKCIVDLSDIGVYPPGGQEFIKNTWFPTIKRLGVRKVAFILPASSFGTASMEKAHQEVENSEEMLHIGNFKYKDEAREWISNAVYAS